MPLHHRAPFIIIIISFKIIGLVAYIAENNRNIWLFN